MTAREVVAFQDMFNMIFEAVTNQKKQQKRPDRDPSAPSSPSPLSSLFDTSIGKPERKMGDLFGKLRHGIKWTTASDELLDRKKEEMDLCDTDVQLINWAMREVFGESTRYETAARRTLSATPSSGATTADPESDPSSSAPTTMHTQSPDLQPTAYPHLLAHLMRTFREKHRDPHLALSMFEYARHLSIPSYVFGCSTPAYNELIETRWCSFRDLRGVLEALEEMRVNGVEPNSRTHQLAERVRRDIGHQKSLMNGWRGFVLWEVENAFAEKGDVWAALARIEALAVKESARKSSSVVRQDARPWDAWKNAILNSRSHSDDGWEFNQWDRDRLSKQYSSKLDFQR
jgi:Mtf2 family